MYRQLNLPCQRGGFACNTRGIYIYIYAMDFTDRTIAWSTSITPIYLGSHRKRYACIIGKCIKAIGMGSFRLCQFGVKALTEKRARCCEGHWCRPTTNIVLWAIYMCCAVGAHLHSRHNSAKYSTTTELRPHLLV